MRLLLPLCATVLPALLGAQTITWSWPNSPCTQLLSCDTGCTACNLPVNSDAMLIGSNLGRQGVDLCPHVIQAGDNVLDTYGWPAASDGVHRLMLSAIALTPVWIDSLIVRHGSAADGPQRLRISATTNNGTEVMVSDDVVPTSMGITVVTGLGCIAATNGMAYGTFEIDLRAYQGAGGPWRLDQVLLVATPCGPTGMQEIGAGQARASAPSFDVLGRSVGADPAPGVYGASSRRLVVR